MSWLDATPDLLEVARAALRADLLPALPPERRYHGAMIANALAVASRELRLGPAAREAEQHALAALLGSTDQALGELRRSLCHGIRAGLHDGERSATLRAILREAVRRRLEISNPEHLTKHGG